MNDFNQLPRTVIQATNRPVHVFNTEIADGNIDPSVVKSFGEEWEKFSDFSDVEIDRIGRMYFDILDDTILNKNTYAIDVGCGTGRWTKYLLDKIGFMEAIDPSDAIFVADKLLRQQANVRLSKASTDNIPFADQTFDFGMSVGVLHHIPDTQKAMSDCVKKIKIGGHFYVYLYYDLENKGWAFKTILSAVTALRTWVSSLSTVPKKFVCDLLAVFAYMPLVLAGRLLKTIGLRSLADKLPLNAYQDQSFFVIRNDALDRFGTSLEQRFSRAQITMMMQNAGLTDVRIADTLPYWHAVGRRVR
jgi:ubiquinone/menaquinone biosynthesis C-methylase UbiE